MRTQACSDASVDQSRCVCMSQRPGIRYRPRPSTVRVPAGTTTSSAGPIWMMRSSSTSTVLPDSTAPASTSTTATSTIAREGSPRVGTRSPAVSSASASASLHTRSRLPPQILRISSSE